MLVNRAGALMWLTGAALGVELVLCSGCVSKGDTVIAPGPSEEMSPEEEQSTEEEAGATVNAGASEDETDEPEADDSEDVETVAGETSQQEMADDGMASENEAPPADASEPEGEPDEERTALATERPTASFSSSSYSFTTDQQLSPTTLTQVTIADVDGESGLDVVVPLAGSVDVFLNDGEGALSAPQNQPELSPNTPLVGDFSGDGLMDLFVVQTYSMALLEGFGGGLFAAPDPEVDVRSHPGGYPTGGVAVSLDGDGAMDAYVWDAGYNAVRAWLGASEGAPGEGAMKEFPLAPAHGGVVGHFNDDEAPDLAVSLVESTSSNGRVGIALGDSGGGFKSGQPQVITVGVEPWGMTSADFDGNGAIDLAVANEGSDSVTVLRSGGTGEFGSGVTLDTAQMPRCIAAGHFDEDDHADLVVVGVGAAGSGLATAQVFFGRGDATFFDPVSVNLGGTSFCIGVQDMDGDGDDDLIVLGANELRLLLNER